MYILNEFYMIICGIDLGSRHVGLSIIETDDLSEVPTLVKLIKAEYIHLSADLIGDRLHVMLKRLEKEVEDNLVDMIVYEESVCKGRNAPGLMYVAGIFHLVASMYGLPIKNPKPTEIKKLITGSGTGDKTEVEIAALKWLTNPPANLTNNHVSDSLAIALYGYLKYNF